MQIPTEEQPNKVSFSPFGTKAPKRKKENLRVPRVGVIPAGREVRCSAGVGRSVRRRLDLKTIWRERHAMLRDPLCLRSDVLLGSGRRHVHRKCPHDALLTNPRLLGFCMLLILTVVDCRGEAKDLSHAAC
jgi:hypothetical protein